MHRGGGLMARYVPFVVGLLIISFGVSMMVHVNEVGLEPWGSAFVGLSKNVGLTYGFWMIASHVIFIGLAYLVEKRPPRVGTFINMMVVGPSVDALTYFSLFPNINSIIGVYSFYIAGIMIASLGISFVIVSKVGAGSKTQFYMVVHNKTGLRILYCKYLMEGLGLFLAITFGGPLFIGTIIFIITSGYFIDVFVGMLERILPHYEPI